MTKPLYGALDIATLTGVAVGHPFDPIEFLTWDLKKLAGGGPRPIRFNVLRSRILTLGTKYNFTKVFIELPMDARQMFHLGTPIETQMLLTGAAAIAEMTLDELGVEVGWYDRQEILQHFTGQKRYKGKDMGKKACVARCAQLGWRVEGFDQADAAALFDFGCAREKYLQRYYAQIATERPLPRILETNYAERIGGSIRQSRRKRKAPLPLFR